MSSETGISAEELSSDEVSLLDRWWRAANYLSSSRGLTCSGASGSRRSGFASR